MQICRGMLSWPTPTGKQCVSSKPQPKQPQTPEFKHTHRQCKAQDASHQEAASSQTKVEAAWEAGIQQLGICHLLQTQAQDTCRQQLSSHPRLGCMHGVCFRLPISLRTT